MSYFSDKLQFDLLARQELFASRYKIVVPSEENIFDHFLNTDSKMCLKSTWLTSPITPKVCFVSALFHHSSSRDDSKLG